MKAVTEKGCLSLDQAAEDLGVSKSTIRKHLHEIRHFRIGRSLRIRKSDLDEWLSNYVIEPETFDVRAVVDDVVARVIEREEESND